MRHITYGEKSLLIGDEAAEVLMEYAAALANAGRGDSVRFHAIGGDGNDVVADALLDAGSNLVAESASTQAAEPDNAEAIDYMRKQIKLLAPETQALVVSTQLTSDKDFPEFDDLPDFDEGR